MNLCITGALGHIGSALIRNLSIPNLTKVYLVDNLRTKRYASLFDLPKKVPFEFHPINVQNAKMEPIIQQSDVLIHLAALTNAKTSYYKPEKLEQHNKKALDQVATLCAKHGVKLFFPSSTSVYSVQKGLVKEEAKGKDLKPQTPYAESKLYGEKLLASLAKKNNLAYVIFRLGTIYGWSIGMRFHTAVNKFIWQACLGKKITVWETALNQKRPYCDLTDAIAAINHVVRQDLFDGQLYNIATSNLTVQEVLDTIKIFIPNLKLKLIDSPIMNQYSYGADISKSLQAGFKYNGKLEDRVRETIGKLKAIINQPNHH